MRPHLGLLDVQVHGGVRLCLLYLHGGRKVGLVSCDGAGRGRQSVSVMTKVGGTSCRELGMRVGLVLHCMVEVEMVRQWLNHLIRIVLPFVVRWSLSALYKF